MACLGQLPPELMLRIIQYTDNSSLRSLRTVCRSLSVFATPELFKTVTLRVIEQSYARLESILEHPVLRSCVRGLLVDTGGWRPDLLVSEPDHGYGPEMYERRIVIDSLHGRFANLMLRLKEFVNLRHASLCFKEYWSIALEPSFFAEMLRFLLSCVLSLDHLPLGLGFYNLQNVDLSDKDTTMLKQVLGNLTSLRLNVQNADFVIDIGSPGFNPKTDPFYILCSQLPSVWLKPASSTLRHLALYSSSYIGFNPKLNFRGVHFPHLECLELGFFCFFCDSQLDWILSHRSTLRELYLDHCPILCQVTIREDFLAPIQTRVTYGKRWHDYFRAFQEELPLLRHFMYGVNSDWYGKWMIFEEEHTIKIGLYEDSYGTLLSGNWTSEHPDCRDEDDRALEALLRKTGQRK
ncbi:hypothetical protein FQN51_005034 [Onygenales sp. PD_10]|nr:hypothetical protein FQN51_005034 [Onygenales sp. PD_10]